MRSARRSALISPSTPEPGTGPLDTPRGAMVLNARTSVPGGPPDRLRMTAVTDGADRACRIAVVAHIGRTPSGVAPGSAASTRGGER